MDIDDLELDVSPHDSDWFASMLLNCFNALRADDEATRNQIRGRIFVLRDLFNLSEEEVIELASNHGWGDEMAETLGDEP